jgi:hypothetical protein
MLASSNRLNHFQSKENHWCQAGISESHIVCFSIASMSCRAYIIALLETNATRFCPLSVWPKSLGLLNEATEVYEQVFRWGKAHIAKSYNDLIN